MKKIVLWSLISSAVAIGCARKVAPDSDGDISSKREKKAEKEMEKEENRTASTSSGSNTSASFNNLKGSASPALENSISLDKGKTVYVSKCGGCHALKTPGDYTSDQINAFLNTEISRAKLNKKDADQLTAYLFANAKK